MHLWEQHLDALQCDRACNVFHIAVYWQVHPVVAALPEAPWQLHCSQGL